MNVQKTQQFSFGFNKKVEKSKNSILTIHFLGDMINLQVEKS